LRLCPSREPPPAVEAAHGDPSIIADVGGAVYGAPPCARRSMLVIGLRRGADVLDHELDLDGAGLLEHQRALDALTLLQRPRQIDEHQMIRAGLELDRRAGRDLETALE